MSNTKSINSEKIRTLAVTGIMCSIAIILSFPFIGTLPLLPVAATVAFLPVLVTTVTLGLGPGLAVAMVAGVASMLRGFVAPMGLLGIYFQNPLISILPRLLIPIAVWLCFKGLMAVPLPKSIDKVPLAVGISVAAGSLANTAGVLGSLYLYYAAPLRNGGPLLGFHPPLAGLENDTIINSGVTAFLFGIAATNGAMEVVVNTLIATILVLTLRNAKFSKL